jgi:hypothetical protein
MAEAVARQLEDAVILKMAELNTAQDADRNAAVIALVRAHLEGTANG